MKRFIYGWGSIWVQNEALTCCFLSFYRAMGGRYRHAAGKWEFAGAKPPWGLSQNANYKLIAPSKVR